MRGVSLRLSPPRAATGSGNCKAKAEIEWANDFILASELIGIGLFAKREGGLTHQG
jgi:hypothetical protein